MEAELWYQGKVVEVRVGVAAEYGKWFRAGYLLMILVKWDMTYCKILVFICFVRIFV
jgi:hypothetical protein